MARFLTIALLICICTQALGLRSGSRTGEPQTMVLGGLQGYQLAQAIADNYKPQNFLTDPRDRWATVSRYAVDANGCLIDYFNCTANYKYSGSIPVDFSLVPVVAPGWWNPADHNLQPQYDLHNMFPGLTSVADIKGEAIPGYVARPTAGTTAWLYGEGDYTVNGYSKPTNMWEPPAGLKGDVARILMYCGLIYHPDQIWRSTASAFYEDLFWPVFTPYGLNLIMEWHRADPVDEAEILRNRIITQSQGNSNPFVDYPDLAEYLWGDKAGFIFDEPQTPGNDTDIDQPGNDPDTPGTPDEPARQPVALKARYSISADSTLDLYSPYISSDAVWTIDGRPTTDLRISLSLLGTGRHELKYVSDTAKGRLLIIVEP